MPQAKRSAATEDGPRKKSKQTKHDQTSKLTSREKHSTNESPQKPKRKPTGNDTSKSVLNVEEKAFPRGGASALTPLEQKQIQTQATRDVLFEQSGSKKPARDADDDLPDSDLENEGVSKTKTSNKRKRNITKQRAATDEDETRVKIQGLSYKRLVPGSVVLGQVVSITSRDVTLALPNNIFGYVPITQISDQVTHRVEKLLADDEDEDTSDTENTDFQDVDLKKLFKTGQYLRAVVTSTEDEARSKPGGKVHRKIELSVNPRDTNQALSVSDAVVGSMISASIRSIEDHGLIMDMGLSGATSGFLPFKELATLDKSHTEEGMVLLCLVTGVSDDKKIVKLSADATKAGSMKKSTFVTDTPTIDSLLPGTAVEIFVTDSSVHGITGKIMGMLDVTADLIHSGASFEDVSVRYKVGSKTKARIVCTFPTSSEKKLGVSMLDHVVKLSDPIFKAKKHGKTGDALHVSSIIDQAQVTNVRPGVGLFMNLGSDGVSGFAHISRLSDKKIDTISEDSGAYKIGSKHRARVVGYNPMDGLYLLSLEEKVLQQPFLRIEDVQVGQTVKGKVERIVLNERGIGGIIVNLAENLSGLVPEMHLADIHLQHPERKFREGLTVTARVLSTDTEKRLIRLTLKKTLLNSEARQWKDYRSIEEGDQSVGTLVKVLATGAVVQFYGDVRAFLPVAEMSDAYIQDPTQHFRVGQVVTVRALNIEPEESKMTVTCRDATVSVEQQKAFDALEVGAIVRASVTEKSEEDLTLALDDSELRATLTLEHLSDSSRSKNIASLKRIRVGQQIPDLLVLEKRAQRHAIILSNKPSLMKAARAGVLVSKFEDVLEGKEVYGFVRNITLQGVYVRFGGGIVGLLLKSHIEDSASRIPGFGLRIGQSLSAKVLSIDHSEQRFLLTQREPKDTLEKQSVKSPVFKSDIVHPVDGDSNTILDYSFGKATKARITAVKDTQLNVQLADNIQGRVDVSEVFSHWEAIKDRKQPLRVFKPKQIIDVRILGVHDARNHRFLPITHRVGKTPVFELSMKDFSGINTEADVLSLDKVKTGTDWMAFINNIGDRCVWVNISPNVRGRIDFMDLTNDVSRLSNIQEAFPVGSAVQVRVKNVDIAANKLDLVASSLTNTGALEISRVSTGMILPGRVTNITERQLVIQLSSALSGSVGLTDLTDDYDQIDLAAHTRNDIVRVCITDVDSSNNRVFLSLRPSKVLSSALPVKDRQILDLAQLKVGDVVRGFVKNVADQGLFVSLGPRVTAFVRVSDLSDAFIKDWKSAFEIDQLVKGKVVSIDEDLNHIQLSLKESVLDQNYKPPVTLNALKVGQIVTGKVRKVETFGVFVLVDNSSNLSGLCHRSEIADGPVDDIRNIYTEGDRVKAKVLKIDLGKRRVNFGLKASYFQTDVDEDEMSVISGSDDLEDRPAIDMADDDSEGDMVDGGVFIDETFDEDSDAHEVLEDNESTSIPKTTNIKGLSAGAFDWSGSVPLQAAGSENEAESSDEELEVRKKRRRKPEIKVDRTGDLDKYGPQSVADYERQLLGQPNNSSLWIQYMAFQLQLNELEQARELAERALRTIHIREEDEKLNVWVALLNLENTYGSDETLEEAFKRACQYNDPAEMHQRLASIYIDSGKHDKADELFQAMMKQKAITVDKSFWLNYATFLMTTRNEGQRARGLLPRAMQSVHQADHLRLTTTFGSLEFTSPNGDPERGRTVFEGILSSFPNRGDMWDMFVDIERSHGDAENVRGLFERMSKQKMKKRRANFVFKRWLEFEESRKNKKGVEKVKTMQGLWEKKHQTDDTLE